MRLLIAVLVALTWPALAGAQPTAALSGLVADQTGAPLAGVRVTIRGAVDRTADTGVNGGFAFRDLPPGDYELSAELAGFGRDQRAIRVQAAEPVTVSVTLHLAILQD